MVGPGDACSSAAPASAWSAAVAALWSKTKAHQVAHYACRAPRGDRYGLPMISWGRFAIYTVSVVRLAAEQQRFLHS